jgi:hypothetical protein
MRAVALPVAVGAEQHGRKAAAVEQHQALLAALHALGDGRDQRRREHRFAGLLAMSTRRTRGSSAAPMRLGMCSAGSGR